MILDIDVRLDYRLDAPGSAILQIEAAATEGQRVLSQALDIARPGQLGRVAADEGVGERVLLALGERLEARYRAEVEIVREEPGLAGLPAVPVHELPAPAVRYLMGSRFCQPERFQAFVEAEFSATSGGARIAALRDWISAKIGYVPGASQPGTTAVETFVQRQGVCRDFAHVMIALARASGIPARFASVYAPDVEPPDFHAVAEVFLEGGWHLVDATGMATAGDMAVIGVGRDAADVAFLTVYGVATLEEQEVAVTRAKG